MHVRAHCPSGIVSSHILPWPRGDADLGDICSNWLIGRRVLFASVLARADWVRALPCCVAHPVLIPVPPRRHCLGLCCTLPGHPRCGTGLSLVCIDHPWRSLSAHVRPALCGGVVPPTHLKGPHSNALHGGGQTLCHGGVPRGSTRADHYIWRLLRNTQVTVAFSWLKGHVDIPGTEISDTISKWNGHGRLIPMPVTPQFHVIHRIIHMYKRRQ